MRSLHGAWMAPMFAVVLAATVPLTGCGDDNGDGTEPPLITLADLEGTWAATSFTIAAKDNPIMAVDIVALGGTVTMDADDAGNFTGQLVYPPPPLSTGETVPFNGTVELVDQQTIKVTFDEEFPPLLTNFTGPFTYEDDTMTITDEDAAFDFGDGVVPATANVVFVRS